MSIVHHGNASPYVDVPFPPDARTVERFAHALWALRLPFVTAEWTGETEVIRDRFRDQARFVLSHALAVVPDEEA